MMYSANAMTLVPVASIRDPCSERETAAGITSVIWLQYVCISHVGLRLKEHVMEHSMEPALALTWRVYCEMRSKPEIANAWAELASSRR